MKLHYVFVLGGASSLFFNGDFRSTLDDVDVFCAVSFLALKEYCTLISVHFPRWYIGVFLLTICLSVLIALSCFVIYTFGWVSDISHLASFSGYPSGFLHTVSAIFCGWIMTVSP